MENKTKVLSKEEASKITAVFINYNISLSPWLSSCFNRNFLLTTLQTINSDEQWKQRLTKEEYNICRLKDTEPKYSGEYLKNKEQGIYNCICCGYDLFSSIEKYDSGCGWPSFTSAKGYNANGDNGAGSAAEHLDRTDDNSYGYLRIEITCKNCGSHVGHVFQDGPGVNGERFCVNSISVKFSKKD